MSTKITFFCRKFSVIISFLLFLQVTKAQNNFKDIEVWLNNNLEQLGGRAVLIIYKNARLNDPDNYRDGQGKIIFSKAENGMSNRQKLAGRLIAKRQGKDASKSTEDFTIKSKIAIASCSKWLSAALIMTFVDEGKLSLEDSVGKFLPIMTANGKGNIEIWQCLRPLNRY